MYRDKITGLNTFVEWQDVELFVEQLGNWCRTNNYDFDGIYGVKRGGLVPAVMLSHNLGKPLIDKPTFDSIIVDDIVDTGKTLKKYHNKGYLIASMFYTDWSSFQPDFSMFKKTEGWIIYPWER